MRRKEFGLASLFGASFAGKVDGPMLNSYLALDEGGPDAKVLFAGLEGVPRIINAANQVDAKPIGGGTAAVNIVPSYPDLPMEEVFQRSQSTSGPGVYLSRHGKGAGGAFSRRHRPDLLGGP